MRNPDDFSRTEGPILPYHIMRDRMMDNPQVLSLTLCFCKSSAMRSISHSFLELNPNIRVTNQSSEVT